MKGSLRIGRLFGIDAFVHWTFVLIPALALFGGLQSGGGWAAAAVGVLFVLSIFACVLLHELGHALAARQFGIKTRDITLLPIGGIARLERMPDVPGQELWIALAGPLVNVVIAAVIFIGLALVGGSATGLPTEITVGSFLASLMWTNVALVVFNMIPAFPLDGGRVLRSLLALRFDWVKATNVAASIGQTLAVGLGLLALLSGRLLLVFISLFVFFAARAEAQAARTRSTFRGIRVREAMMTDVAELQEDDTLEVAAKTLLAGAQRDFPVLRGESFTGILTRQALMQGLSKYGMNGVVGRITNRECPTVGPDDMVEMALPKLQEGESLPVAVGDKLHGLLTVENVLELQMISEVLPASQRAA